MHDFHEQLRMEQHVRIEGMKKQITYLQTENTRLVTENRELKASVDKLYADLKEAERRWLNRP